MSNQAADLENRLPEDPDCESKNAGFDSDKRRRVFFWVKVMVSSLGLIGCVLSLTLPSLRKLFFREIALWKWCVLITAPLSGLMLSQALQLLIVLLVEHDISMKENVIYYVVGTIQSAWTVLWFGIILLAWTMVAGEPSTPTLFRMQADAKVRQRFVKTSSIITLTLITLVSGSIICLLKDIFMMIGKSSFHLRRFRVRVRRALIDHYMIETLFLDPTTQTEHLEIELDDVGSVSPCCEPWIDKLRERRNLKRGFVRRRTRKVVIHNDYLHYKEIEDNEMTKVSCWGMEILIHAIVKGKPPCATEKNNEFFIMKEEDAIHAADALFNKVFGDTPSNSHQQYEEQIQNYFDYRQKDCKWLYERAGIFQLEDQADAAEIKEVFRKCMVRAWRYRTTLVQALQDNKRIFITLKYFVNVMLVLIVVLIWLAMVYVEFRKAIVVAFTAIVGSAFIFGDFAKKLVDNFAFIFILHPFDVGDWCLIEDAPVVISRMTLLSTVALTLSNEKRHYSNATLCAMTITNYTRSSSRMGDFLVFHLKPSTTVDQINQLIEEIKSVIFNDKQHHWMPEHTLEMEMASRPKAPATIKATLRYKHKTNFHDWAEKESKKTKLTTQLKLILDSLSKQPNHPARPDAE